MTRAEAICPEEMRFRAQVAVLVIFCAFKSEESWAHHNPGHGSTESLQAISSFGGDPRARQRATVIVEATRSTDQPDLNVANSYSLRPLLQLEWVEGFYSSIDLPLVVVDQAEASRAQFGLGDIRLGLSYQGLDSRRNPFWTAGFSLNVPTRTYQFSTDPGRQWILTPMFGLTPSFGELSFYALILTPFEIRPAGSALDISPTVGASLQLAQALAVSLGSAADIRVLNTCNIAGERSVCQGGRPSENEREAGATRVYGSLALKFSLAKALSLYAVGQMPFTSKKDIEWSTSLSLEWRFGNGKPLMGSSKARGKHDGHEHVKTQHRHGEHQHAKHEHTEHKHVEHKHEPAEHSHSKHEHAEHEPAEHGYSK
ncbi:MAG: transporter [Polyangiaceae bacterium]|nr:transporter [Polyangiaceae bacterium]